MPATANKTRKASSKRKTRKAAGITAGQAWEALGGNEKFKPQDMDAPASNRMLWALNDQGRLSIS